MKTTIIKEVSEEKNKQSKTKKSTSKEKSRKSKMAPSKSPKNGALLRKRDLKGKSKLAKKARNGTPNGDLKGKSEEAGNQGGKGQKRSTRSEKTPTGKPGPAKRARI